MICTCDNCLYTFENKARPDRCPDCGWFAVRNATEEEIAWYLRVHAEDPDED